MSVVAPIPVDAESVDVNLFVMVSFEHRDPFAQFWRSEDQRPGVTPSAKKAHRIHASFTLGSSSHCGQKDIQSMSREADLLAF